MQNLKLKKKRNEKLVVSFAQKYINSILYLDATILNKRENWKKLILFNIFWLRNLLDLNLLLKKFLILLINNLNYFGSEIFRL